MTSQAVSSWAPAALACVALAVADAALIAGCAHAAAVALLCAVAMTQAATGMAWVLASDVPGRAGAIAIGVLAAAGADVAVSLYPHARLQPLLPVVGLALSVMFVHQLQRRARRQRVTASLSATAVLVLLVIAPTALLQLRVELGSSGAAAVTAVAVAGAAGLAAGILLDSVVPVARFDRELRGGLPGVLAAAAAGVVAGYLALRGVPAVATGGAVFAGGLVGVVGGLLAIASTFVAGGTGPRAALAALMPMTLVAPVGLLVLLAVRV